MRRFTLTILGLLLIIAPLAGAEEWSKTFAITAKPELRVETSDANIRVDTWNQNMIEARVNTVGYKIGDGGIQVVANQTGDIVALEVRFPHDLEGFHLGHRQVDIEIHMPREGSMNLHTDDGNIGVTDFKGDMTLKSGDGDEVIQSVEGSLRANTGDGNVRAGGIFDTLDVETGDGDVEVQVLSGSRLESGWNLQTGDGNVTLRVPQELSADLELHTGDGHITANLPVTVEGKVDDNHLRGKLNQGGNLLSVHTGDGSILVEKS
jgi:DUF4097 and DUF4098 domain-containing protein YvlB